LDIVAGWRVHGLFRIWGQPPHQIDHRDLIGERALKFVPDRSKTPAPAAHWIDNQVNR